MLKDSFVKIDGKKFNLKMVQTIYKSIIEEFFSGKRGIVECAAIGESIPFKVNYIYEFLKVFSQLSSPSPNSYVVDLGCERGDMLLLLKQLGFKNLCGVNLTPYDLRWLAEKIDYGDLFGDANKKVRYLTCDLDHNKLPFKDGEVSAFILSDTIDHLRNPGWVLSEMNRCLVKGGIVVIGTPNITSIKNRLYLLFGRSFYGDLKSWLGTDFRLNGHYVGHTREYTMTELKYICKTYGFDPVSCKFAPTLTLLGEAREKIPPYLFKLYTFFEKIWPGGRHRLVIVSKKVTNYIDPRWIPIPFTALQAGKGEKNEN